MKTIKFLKKPKIGNKVKVYINDKKTSFGIVTGLAMKKEFDYFRQVVILEKSEREFSLDETDLFLEAKKVVFKN